MSWLILTIFGQFLNSIAALFDKYLVTSKRITTPILFVFYTGVLTLFGVALYIPSLFFPNTSLPHFSNIFWIGFGSLFILMCASVSQLIGLWALFSSLKKNDASDVVPVIGSLSAIFSLIIGFLFINTKFSPTFMIGFGFLVFGTFLISRFRFSYRTFLFTLLGGFTFALYSILLKVVLITTSFDAGFFFTTISTAFLSFFLLLSPRVRNSFNTQRKEKHIKMTGVLLFINKLIAGIGGILLIKATEIGEVPLIQALGGLQFLFLFLFAVILGPTTSVDLGENVKHKDIYQKLVAISIIFIGFILLFI